MELVARTLYGSQTLELTHVAYVEGFLTSLLGLARCRTESIHFDSGRDVLYMHQPTNVIAQLEYCKAQLQAIVFASHCNGIVGDGSVLLH